MTHCKQVTYIIDSLDRNQLHFVSAHRLRSQKATINVTAQLFSLPCTIKPAIPFSVLTLKILIRIQKIVLDENTGLN